MNGNQTKLKFNLTFLLATMFVVMLIQNIFVQHANIEEISYDTFLKHLNENKIAEVVVSDTHIKGTLKEGDKGEKKQFITVKVEDSLADKLSAHQVKFTRTIENTFFKEILSWVIPTLLFFGLWLFIIRRMAGKGGLGGGFMAVGKSKAKVYVESDTKTTFNDVAGVDEAKEELKEVVDFLKDAKSYGRLGARAPKGVLLVGPPGTGKTLLARAVAGEAGVTFFSISGSEFVEMFVGIGAARVKDLFEQARGKSPCIIFIDELDALGRARSASTFGGGHDEKEQTLNQLLVEMDGFDVTSGIIILAATNRPEILDPALLRAGRFDRQVLVDRPEKQGRIAILKLHIKKVKIAADLAIEQVAALTPGFTGADLANLVNEAALIATRRNAAAITLSDFTAAMERIVAGLEKKNRLLNPREREFVAYHEMGHALVSCAIPGSDAIHKVSIIPRGIGSLGYTIQRPTEDRYLMTQKELENKMMVLMGGRAAEFHIFHHFSTGAADDLSKATDIARSMVTKYGMEAKLGHVSYENRQTSFLGGNLGEGFNQGRNYSEATAHDIDSAVKLLVDAAFHRSLAILQANSETLKKSAVLLLAQETIDEKDLKELFSDLKTLA